MINALKKLFFSKDAKTRLIFIIGIVGIFLIGLSEIIPDEEEAETESVQSTDEAFDEAQEYKEELEKELCDIVSQIQGVGNVSVMITIGSTREYIYVEQIDEEINSQSDQLSSTNKSEIALADDGSAQQPIIRKIVAPQISGAVVVCTGADNALTKERVLNAVLAALGIETRKISVEAAKS
ncbi:MAG: hypothetical protein LUE12_02125 [Ruminococcus sp.]|nr:hypothetical protein [Ruminococcus sp.]